MEKIQNFASMTSESQLSGLPVLPKKIYKSSWKDTRINGNSPERGDGTQYIERGDSVGDLRLQPAPKSDCLKGCGGSEYFECRSSGSSGAKSKLANSKLANSSLGLARLQCWR